jgi:hypothetical protein
MKDGKEQEELARRHVEEAKLDTDLIEKKNIEITGLETDMEALN